MNTQKSINTVVWAVAAGIMVFAAVLYASTDVSREHQAGEQTLQQREQALQKREQALKQREQAIEQKEQAQQQKHTRYQSQQQMHSQSRQRATQAGVLCRLDDILGSDVKSDMRQDSARDGQRRMDAQRDAVADRSYGASDQRATLGTVEELILDDQKNEIKYVVLQADNQHYLIPWQAFHVKSDHARGGDQSSRSRSDAMGQGSLTRSGAAGQRQDRSGPAGLSRRGSDDSSKPALYLNLSREQLKQAPTIDSISVKAVSDSPLQQRVDAFYAEHIEKQDRQFDRSGARQFGQQQSPQVGQQQQQAARRDQQQQPQQTTTRRDQQQQQQQQQVTRRGQQTGTDRFQRDHSDQRSMGSAQLFKASDVVGLDLQNNQDDKLGSIDDLLVDTREGQIAYGLVSFGGFLGMRQKTAVVPWNLVTIDADLDYAGIDATEDQLAAAVLEDDNIDKLSEAQFAQKIHNTFNAEPYWQVYGYMPADDDTSESKEDDWQWEQQQQRDQQQSKQQQRERQQKKEQQQKSQQERY